ncbi:MAG: DUF1998 domain-containing protein [Anaerolineae bacterium]|nr:DUF1998 domain-containing protein [Anaerolineae bacterium]
MGRASPAFCEPGAPFRPQAGTRPHRPPHRPLLPGPLGAQSDRSLWLSVLYTLLEGTSEALGVPREDLNGTLYPYPQSPSPALVLFDDVPGGAALVQRILDDPVPVFRAAWRRVTRCECGEETSCYQCLRNYYNQFCHDQLRRGLAQDFLANLLTQNPL